MVEWHITYDISLLTVARIQIRVEVYLCRDMRLEGLEALLRIGIVYVAPRNSYSNSHD